MSHIYHAREENDRPYLFDDCPGCERHTENLGLSLDTDNWWDMWDLMIAAEMKGGDHYMTHAEKKLGTQLYHVYIALERYTFLVPHLTGYRRIEP